MYSCCIHFQQHVSPPARSPRGGVPRLKQDHQAVAVRITALADLCDDARILHQESLARYVAAGLDDETNIFVVLLRFLS